MQHMDGWSIALLVWRPMWPCWHWSPDEKTPRPNVELFREESKKKRKCRRRNEAKGD